MVNLMIRVIMGIGVVTASFVAGQHSTSPHSNLSGGSLVTSTVNQSTTEASTTHGQSTTNTQNTSLDNSKGSAYKISLSEQIRLVDAAALNAVGGGKVMSVAPTSWHNTAAWTVRVAQPTGQYDVIVSKAQHDVMFKKRV